MKKIKIVRIILLSMLIPAFTKAQDSTLNILSEQFNQQYNFLSKDLISQPFLKAVNYSILEGGYHSVSGDYMLAQDAPKQHDYFFNTKGTKKVKNFLVTGLFSYKNTSKDSVAYTLRDNLNDPAPYYFFAGKPGNWLTVNYRLEGMVSSSFLKDKLTAGVGIKYNTSDAWRSNDPRSEYFIYDMSVSGVLQYAVLPKHTIGAEGGLIRKSTDVNLEYRNADNQYSQTKPEYINYMQDGYGYQELKTGNTNIASKTNGYLMKGIYNGIFGFGTVTLKAGYRSTTSQFYQKGSGVGGANAIYGSFYEDLTTVNFLWNYKKNKNGLSLLVDYSDLLGKDFNNMLQGNNYIYSLEELTVKPLFTKYAKTGLVKYEAGLNVAFTDLLRMDGTADQKAEYQYSDASLTAAYYFRFPNNASLLKTTLHAGMRLPMSSEMNIPLQQPAFTKAVIFRDYYYYNATSYNGGIELLYDFPIQKTRTFVKAGVEYTQAQIKEANYVQPTSMPGNNRLYWQLSVGLTL